MMVIAWRAVARVVSILVLVGACIAGLSISWEAWHEKSEPTAEPPPGPALRAGVVPNWRPLSELDGDNARYLSVVLAQMKREGGGDINPWRVRHSLYVGARAEDSTPLTNAEIEVWYRGILEWATVTLPQGRDALLFRWDVREFGYGYGFMYEPFEDYRVLWFDPLDTSGQRAARRLFDGYRFRLQPRDDAPMPDLIYWVNDILDGIYRWNGEHWAYAGVVEVIDPCSWTTLPPRSGKDLLRFVDTREIGAVMSLPSIRDTLYAGFGEYYLSFLKTIDSTPVWNIDDGCLTLKSGDAGYPARLSSILYICRAERDVHAALRMDGQVYLVSTAQRFGDVPLNVRAFIAVPDDETDTSALEELTAPPREGFIWLNRRR